MPRRSDRGLALRDQAGVVHRQRASSLLRRQKELQAAWIIAQSAAAPGKARVIVEGFGF